MSSIQTLTISVLLLIISYLHGAKCQQEDVINSGGTIKTEVSTNTCSTHDLNHSILVECKADTCNGINSDSQSGQSIWPKNQNNIVHMYSSRMGDRFKLEILPNLNFKETEFQRMMDINTTVLVKTDTKYQKIHGFGTTLDVTSFFTHPFDSMTDRMDHLGKIHGLVLKDLFAGSNAGINLSILRLILNQDLLTKNDIASFLNHFDSDIISKFVGNDRSDSKINLILKFDALDKKNKEILDQLKSVSASCKQLQFINCWALSIDQDWTQSGSTNNDGMVDWVEQLFSTKNVLGETKLETAAQFIEQNQSNQNQKLDGFVVKSDFSSPYSIFKNLRDQGNGLNLLSLASDIKVIPNEMNYGDWNNAQNYAMEILKQLEHGSNGFIEESLALDAMAAGKDGNTEVKDCSIYNLQASHNLHLRGPMFYALGHFSRHLLPGSIRLAQHVETQPNMFNANYITFMTPYSNVIVIALNNNEHPTPLRINIDGKIVANTLLKDKSFNTFVIKVQ